MGLAEGLPYGPHRRRHRSHPQSSDPCSSSYDVHHVIQIILHLHPAASSIPRYFTLGYIHATAHTQVLKSADLEAQFDLIPAFRVEILGYHDLVSYVVSRRFATSNYVSRSRFSGEAMLLR